MSVLKNRLLEKASTVLIKLSPMLDISLALQSLPETHEIHVVSVDNECKELLFLLKKEPVNDPVIHCINLQKNNRSQTLVFHRSEEATATPSYTSVIKKYLYEPHTAVLKAGGYKILTSRYQVEKLHPDSHLYTSENSYPDFPGRIFQVRSVFSLNKNDLKTHLSGITKAHITVRNFPSSSEELRKKLKLTPGGETYLFATTICNEKKILLLAQK